VNVTAAVIAKAPRPGRVKTRLSPPCTDDEAARIATVMLANALQVVGAVAGSHPAVLLEGEPGPWLPTGVAVVAQRGGSLEQRLINGFEDIGGPAVIVAMDSPDLSVADLEVAVAALSDGADAVVGPADDGGYWAIGLRRPDRAVLAGVPMSRPDTLVAQRARLDALGLRRVELRALPDVDTFDDALAAADRHPDSALAAVVSDVQRRLAATPIAVQGR
jgi:rSAM/selenodomain-associated transferase 1